MGAFVWFLTEERGDLPRALEHRNAAAATAGRAPSASPTSSMTWVVVDPAHDEVDRAVGDAVALLDVAGELAAEQLADGQRAVVARATGTS